MHSSTDLSDDSYREGQQRFADAVSGVWSRHIDSSRVQMDAAVGDLTIRFSGIVARLDKMLSNPNSQKAADGVDARAAAVGDNSRRRLQHLIVSLRQAMSGKALMLAKVQALEGFLADLSKMAVAISMIAHQTHILSINAAIKAAHAGKLGLGFAVVAEEVRALSKMSAEIGTKISTALTVIQSEIRSTMAAADESSRQDGQAMSDSENTIGEVLSDFSSLTQMLKGSTQRLRDESYGIKQDIDEAIVQLQFQDRVGQVMAHVQQNIELLPEMLREANERFEQERKLCPLDPQVLLAQLEATYAMSEEHDVHQGTGAPRAAAAEEITFF